MATIQYVCPMQGNVTGTSSVLQKSRSVRVDKCNDWFICGTISMLNYYQLRTVYTLVCFND